MAVRRAVLTEPSLVLQGVHYADDVPFCAESRAISLASAPDAAGVDFVAEVPGRWLLRSMPWTTARHAVRAINVAGADAQALDLAVGTACLEILRKTEIGGNWVTYARLLYPGEAYQLAAEFAPGAEARTGHDRAKA